MRKRKLPEAAYDFWWEDVRDDERSKNFDTAAAALADAKRRRRKPDVQFACQIEVHWRVNETKVLALLRARWGRHPGRTVP